VNLLEDRTPRIIRVDGLIVPIVKPLPVGGLARELDCAAYAVLPLPKLSERDPTRRFERHYVMVIDVQALDWAKAINTAATRIFHHNRQPSLGPIRGHVAVLPDGHFGRFYPELS
jgi:hypothetical protein